MAVLHLVRHGQSEWNVARRVQGQSPLAGSLTSIGREQAVRTARLLAQEHPNAEAIFTSDLGRAAETAKIIGAELGLPVTAADPELREQRLGEFEGRFFADPVDGDRTVEDVIDGLWQNPNRRPPGGESVAELYLRVRRALERYATEHAGRELILVTHGGVVRVATTRTDPRLGTPVPRRPVDNAAVATVTFDSNSRT